MKRFSNLMLSAALACCAAAAQAGTGINAADVPRITNGGTGFIGVTESAGMPRQENVRWNAAGDTSSIPLGAGEASTLVNGRPNEDPYAPGSTIGRMGMTRGGLSRELRTMGSGPVGTTGVAGAPAGAHPAWGTPD